ncbi:abortive infection family protein [Mycobacterium sp.]|uniref:abortive infection family protein n=1 Tax=Mycobacterium sp. TaxID=1785 RepID=UPI00334167BB
MSSRRRSSRSLLHSIKRILGGASSVAIGVAELRNQSGTGHGQGRPRTGLGQRHAHLAVNAAFMRCQLMLDTLADPIAPWRKQAAAGGEELPKYRRRRR